MLDLRSKEILKFLVDECNDGAYKIIDADEIIDSLPQNIRIDSENLTQTIKYLENREYISVKYADNQQFCLTPLPFGRQFVETEEIQNDKQKNFSKLSTKICFFVFIFAFLGSFLGILFFNLCENFFV